MSQPKGSPLFRKAPWMLGGGTNLLPTLASLGMGLVGLLLLGVAWGELGLLLVGVARACGMT